MNESEDFGNIDGAASLSAMAMAVDSLSSSAPGGRTGSRRTRTQSCGTPDLARMILSPGGTFNSYGSTHSESHVHVTKNSSLKQAKGTGRTADIPNTKSFDELRSEIRNTPGAEIRIVQSNTGLNLDKSQRLRMKYYDKVRSHHTEENRRRNSMIPEETEETERTPLLAQNPAGFLEYPVHLLPAAFFQIHIPGHHEDERDTQSSLVTILSIWNTMMGTSLLAVPWAINQAGLFTGILIVILMTIISYYTALVVINSWSKHNSLINPVPEFAQLCARLLNPYWPYYWEIIASIFSMLAVLGAAIVYWVLMSNFLYTSVDYCIDLNNRNQTNSSITDVLCPNNHNHPGPDPKDYYEVNDQNNGDDDWGIFTPKTAPLYLLILLPVVSLKSATFFTKFNAIGTLNVVFLTGVILYLASEWGINVDLYNKSSTFYVPTFKKTFPSLSGMMALGLFIHNAIITIMKNNRNQENNSRDLALGFSSVSGTYLLIGTLFYVSFPMDKECIEDNLLKNFAVDNPLMAVVRFFLLLQLFTVFPLIMYIFRCQVLMLISKTSAVSYKKIYFINSMVLSVCVCFAIFIPSIGNIIRYTGALCGAMVVFILPSLLFLSEAKSQSKLTWTNVSMHMVLITLGLANFVAQFLI